MRKYTALFICVSFMCIFMFSCGKPADASANANSPADNNAAASNASGGASGADIFGQISEIAGNMATINLAVMPDTGMPVPGNRPSGFNAANIDPSNLPSGVTINADGSISVDRSAFGGGDGSGGTFTFDPNNMPQDFTGGGGGFQRQTDANGQPVTRQRQTDENGQPVTRQRATDANGQLITRQQTTDANGNPVRGGGFGGMGGMLLNYTGESKEFIIPVGLPIYAVTRADDGSQVETEIQLSEIKAGNVISVSYKADGKTIDKILVSQVTVLSPSEAEAMRNQFSNRTANQDTTQNTVESDSGGGV